MLWELSREIADPASAEVRGVLADLRDTLHDFQRREGFGRGISAVQIAEPIRLIYIEIGGRQYSVLNPRLVAQGGGKLLVWDDCFSFPELRVRLVRSAHVRVDYLDEAGAPQTVETDGDFSELLQHELDHLDGILAVDRAIDRNSFATRSEYEKRYRDQRVVRVGAAV